MPHRAGEHKRLEFHGQKAGEKIVGFGEEERVFIVGARGVNMRNYQGHKWKGKCEQGQQIAKR